MKQYSISNNSGLNWIPTL